MSVCPIDIVIAIDFSGSTQGPSYNPLAASWSGSAGGAYEAQRILLENLIDHLTPGMIAGEIQVGVVFWANTQTSLDPDGFSMSSNHLGDLNTSKVLQDPAGNWHSPIAKGMFDNFLGGGTNIGGGMDYVFTPTTGILNRKSTSDFASQYPTRQNDPDFSQVGVIITDSQNPPSQSGLTPGSGCAYQSSSLSATPTSPSGPANQFVVGVVALSGGFPMSNQNCPICPYTYIRDTIDYITCNQNAGPNSWNTSSSGLVGQYGFYVNINNPNAILNVGAAILSQACFGSVPDSYDCSGSLPNPIGIAWQCYDPGTGLGQYTTYTNCVTNCQNPIPITYDCNDPTTATYNPSLPDYWCYNPGTGLGTYQGLNALINCQSFCQAPVPITYDCSGPPSWNCSVVTGGGGQYSTQAACQAVCFATPPSPSWHCTENMTVVSQGVTYGPWNCYDPGTGLGQHLSLAACQNICVVSPSWDCHMPAPGTTTGICIDPGNGLGQYLVEQDCIDACKTHVIHPPDEPLEVSWNCRMNKYGIGHCDLVLGTSGTYATKALCLAACEQVPILPTFTFPDTWKCHIPWHSIVGTCTKMTDGSGTYTTEQDCIDNCLHAQLLPTLLDTEGWNCDNSTQTCSGPVLGGTYPTQADCQAVCVGIISVGTLCDRVRSCPCGWTYDQTTQECESPIYGIQTMIIGAIENCITFQSPPHQPVVGDIWANLSPSNIPPPYTWNAAEVVEIGGQIQGTSSIEVRSQC